MAIQQQKTVCLWNIAYLKDILQKKNVLYLAADRS